MRLQWDSLSVSGKDKIWFSLLPLPALVSPSDRMSHLVLFHWIMIQIFIAHVVSEPVVRAVTGQSVVLPCSYQVTRHKDISDMCWGRGPCPNSKCTNTILYTTGSKMAFRTSPNYNLRGYIARGDVSLTIGTVKAEDAGIYCCRIEIPGWFNDIKKNIRLEVTRASPVTTTTTRKAPVSPKHFTETTFAPQTTSDLQPTAETAVLLTSSTSTPASTATESPALQETTQETFSPPTIAVTENDIFPVSVEDISALPDFPTTSPAADVTTEDDIFCSTLPGSIEVTPEFPGTLPAAVTPEFPGTLPAAVTPEFPGTLPAAEETTTFVVMEEISAMEVLANFNGNAEKHEDRGDKFPSSAILIACAIAGSVLFILMISLVWKRKLTKKFIIKSVQPPEENEKIFSGAEGENNIFSL